MSERHSLLVRQIRRYLGGEEAVPETLRPFLEAVDSAYRQSDADRGMLERSMDLSSQELMQAMNEVRSSLSLLQATLDSTADGIIAVDRNHRILAFNRRFREMWRLPEDLLRSRSDEQALAFVLDQLKDPEAFLRRVEQLYAYPEMESQDVLEFHDGRVFERHSRPQWIGGLCVGRVASFRDVTEHRRAEEERARLQVMGALGHLVGGLAHEVRNPLFVISATVEALMAGLEDADPAYLRQALENLQEPTARLTELMSELLEYGKPLGQGLTMGSFHDVVSQAVVDCQTLAAEKEVRLGLRSPGRELRVSMIRRRLLMALVNLLQNAIQHTPRGGEVAVELEERMDDGEARVLCAVKDSGPGFQIQDFARIFEPFFTRRKGGTGLGLPIAQRIVEEHGGRIAAGNLPEGGAVITVDLPCEMPISGISS